MAVQGQRRHKFAGGVVRLLEVCVRGHRRAPVYERRALTAETDYVRRPLLRGKCHVPTAPFCRRDARK